jgi:hypothetical protein
MSNNTALFKPDEDRKRGISDGITISGMAKKKTQKIHIYPNTLLR